MKKKVTKEIHALRINEVCRKTELSKSTIYRLIKNGKFPKPKKIGPRARIWLDHEIEQHLLEL